MKKTLVIQIPAFNEEENIAAVLADVPKHIDGIDSIEAIVVDDGSTDKTVAIAKKHCVRHIVSLPEHIGLGRACREGLKYACSIGADIVVNIDADSQYPACEIRNIIQPVLEGDSDMVVADRRLGEVCGYPLYKLTSQYIGNFAVSKMFNVKIKDATSGFRAFSKDTAELLAKELKNDYTYILESICILARHKKRISFVPAKIRYPTRPSRLISSKWFYVRNFVSMLLKYYFGKKHIRDTVDVNI